jgi:hypothetical protein
VIIHAARIGIGIAENMAAGIDPGEARAGGFGKLAKFPGLLGKHERNGSSFFGELLAELAGECFLDALRDKIVDGDQRESENRHQTQDEPTEDARGQGSLSHRSIVMM